jgi:palmitoyltransferase
MPSTAEAEPLSDDAGIRSRRRKRIFSLGGFRFRLSSTRVIDILLHGLSWLLETLVYIIGPLLILLALAIIGVLTFSYFTILLPMLEQKYELSPFKHLLLALHTSFVIFVVGNILFNYYWCLVTKHTGPKYDQLVRVLAQRTGLLYPETPAQMQQYRQDYEDRIYLRMQRRMARSATAGRVTDGGGGGSSNVVQRHATAASSVKAESGSTQQKKESIRAWMIMGPFEWGYCRETNQPKPPRSHYDHVSRKLVLNLDHYCPWMFNASKSSSKLLHVAVWVCSALTNI